MTPDARLRSLAGAERFLKPGLGFALLDGAATAETDLEAARWAQAPRAVPVHRRRQHAHRPRSRMTPPESARLTNVAFAHNIPHIAAAHPNNRPLYGSDKFTFTLSFDSG